MKDIKWIEEWLEWVWWWYFTLKIFGPLSVICVKPLQPIHIWSMTRNVKENGGLGRFLFSLTTSIIILCKETDQLFLWFCFDSACSIIFLRANFNNVNSPTKSWWPWIILIDASAWDSLSLRKSHMGDSGMNTATMIKVMRATDAITSIFKRQNGWTAPRNDIIEPPSAYMNAKPAAATPWWSTFVSSKMNT